LFGAALGLLGSAAVGSFGVRLRLVLLGAAALVAFAADVSPVRVPGPRRQVNERWRTEFRGWVYGSGYGAQLGLGVTTVVSSAATYLAIFAAFLSAEALRGALVLGLFGLLRGLQPLATWRVTHPAHLARFHARFGRWRGFVHRVGCASLVTILAIVIVGALT
jgi:hypothetical protein